MAEEIRKLVLKNYFLQNEIEPVLDERGLPVLDKEGKPQMQIVVSSLQGWLNQELTHGAKARARTRFNKLLYERAEELEKERVVMLQKYSKNKKGEVVYLKADGKKTTDEKERGEDFSYAVNDMEAFKKERNEYLQEDFIIDVTPSNKEDVNGVKAILTETNAKFNGIQGARYDEWLQCLEQVWAKKENKK